MIKMLGVYNEKIINYIKKGNNVFEWFSIYMSIFTFKGQNYNELETKKMLIEQLYLHLDNLVNKLCKEQLLI